MNTPAPRQSPDDVDIVATAGRASARERSSREEKRPLRWPASCVHRRRTRRGRPVNGLDVDDRADGLNILVVAAERRRRERRRRTEPSAVRRSGHLEKTPREPKKRGSQGCEAKQRRPSNEPKDIPRASLGADPSGAVPYGEVARLRPLLQPAPSLGTPFWGEGFARQGGRLQPARARVVGTPEDNHSEPSLFPGDPRLPLNPIPPTRV